VVKSLEHILFHDVLFYSSNLWQSSVTSVSRVLMR